MDVISVTNQVSAESINVLFIAAKPPTLTYIPNSFFYNNYVFPTNAHYLLHKIFTILANMFRSQGPSSGQCIQ
jgi:hypothetical protein